MNSIWTRIDNDGIRSYKRNNMSAVIEGEPGKYYLYLPVPNLLKEFEEWTKNNDGNMLKLGPFKKLNKAKLKADNYIKKEYYSSLENLANQLKHKRDNPTESQK